MSINEMETNGKDPLPIFFLNFCHSDNCSRHLGFSRVKIYNFVFFFIAEREILSTIVIFSKSKYTKSSYDRNQESVQKTT